MKKTTLLFIAAVAFAGVSASAQAIYLTGNSYSQNFNALGSGLPAGWALYTKATATDSGTNVTTTKFNAATIAWNKSTGGFRNSASLNGITLANYTNDSATQAAITDRALAVRQVGNTNNNFPGSDSGAAFVFKFVPAANSADFKLNFKLQGADTSSAYVTTWKVQYGMKNGTMMAYTDVPTVTGTLTTGGKILSNNTVSVDFGNALDNMNQEMWIRIVTLQRTSGPSGSNRTTTQIDDFNLTWNNSQGVNTVVANNLPLTMMTLLHTGGGSNVQAAFNAPENGKYRLTVTDLNGRSVATLEGTAAKGELVVVPVTHTTLASGMYLVRVAQGAFSGTARFTIQ